MKIGEAMSRNESIDFIRGLSIISVILLHIHIRIPFNQGWLESLLPQKLVNILFFSGYYGVMAFFVVSGFLITTASLKRWTTLSNIRYGQFFRIRFARIMPCLAGLIIILCGLHLLGVEGFVITNTSLKQAVFSALTFHINWLEAQIGYLPGPWDVLWSLSVEEAFYIFFPLLCIFVRNELVFKLILFTFIILGPFARCGFSDNEMWSDHSYLSCMDGIAMGCLAALFANKRVLTSKALKYIFTLGFLLFVFVFVFRKQVAMLGLSKIGLNVTLLEAGIALILISLHQWSIQSPYQKSKFSTPILWFGRNSYEVYLTHSFIVIFMTQLFKKLSSPVSIVIPWYLAIMLLSGVIGHIVARYYSEPLNKLLKKKLLSVDLSFQQTEKVQVASENS